MFGYAVQERCRASMRTKPTLGELVKLDADAEQLPGIIPEMDALNRCRLICPLPVKLHLEPQAHADVTQAAELQAGGSQVSILGLILPYLCSGLSAAMCTAHTLLSMPASSA